MLCRRYPSVLAGALVSAFLAASARNASAQQAPQSPPQCRLTYRSNFRLNGAQQYLVRVQSSNFEDDKRRFLNDALRVLGEAAAQDRNADQLTLWFFFGQAYAYRKDLRGADSAFRRVEAVADADCRREVQRRRRNEYVPIQNAAVEQIQTGNQDSALALFRQGMVIYRDDPGAYVNMAGIFGQRDNTDSAVYYYRLAATTGDEPRHNELRKTALVNAARTLHRAQRFADAEVIYREYVTRYPNDMEARTNLAGVLTAQAKHAEAGEIYNQLLANADSLDSFDLFETGVALFRQGQQDSTQRQQRYSLAARAFELGLAKNPLYRDALFNLTNTYLAVGDTARLLNAAQRLIAIDPMNRQSLQLLAAAHQRNRNRDQIIAALARRDSLPWELSILRFDPRDSTAAIRGGVQNLQNRELRGFNLTLEFVNGTGEAVTREVVEIPNLSPQGQPGSVYDFNLTANGRGIIAFRYRTN